MSREFGSYEAGYFHTQIQNSADDASAAQYEITRKWGAVLTAFCGIAYTIASAEAGDSNEDEPIFATIRDLPKLEAALEDLKKYIAPFQSVAEQAVREALRR